LTITHRTKRVFRKAQNRSQVLKNVLVLGRGRPPTAG
jgi:hypothetical protein